MDYIFYLFCLLSFVLGGLFTLAIIFHKTHGILVMDETGEKTNWSFIVERPIEEFEKSKLVIFRVKRNKSA